MFGTSEIQNRNTLKLLFSVIQSTLTKSISKANLNEHTVSPTKVKEFDENTTTIIFEKMHQKIQRKG